MATKGATILGTNPNDPIYPQDQYDGDTARGGPAFTLHRGLTKREHFAGLAMQALLASRVDFFEGPTENPRNKGEICSDWAVSFADALILGLNKEKK
jgi:hypothetical protein